MRLALAALTVFLSNYVVAEQHGELRFRRFDSSDGLSNNWVRSFHQDSSGIMWIGTNDSLNRFDGHEFKMFRPKSGEDGGKQHTAINAIISHGKNELWVSTNVGLYSFDSAHGEFELNQQIGSLPVLDVTIDSKGQAWVASSRGLQLIGSDGELKKEFSHDADDPSSIPDHYVNTVLEDSRGRIIVATKGGLSFYDETSERFVSYRTGSDLEGASSTDYLDLAEDRQGRIWLVTQRNGLELMEDDETGKPSFRKVCSGSGTRLMIDRENVLWQARGSGGGLVRIDIDAFTQSGEITIEEYYNEIGNEWSLSDDSLFKTYQDAQGDIWIGTYGSGFCFYSKRSKPFSIERKRGGDPRYSLSENMITALFEDDDYLWVGTMSGLEQQNKATGEYVKLGSETEEPSPIGSNPIYAFCKDRQGRLWIGGWSTGLNLYNYQNETITRFMPSSQADSIGAKSIFSILEDDQGTIWLGTLGGGLNRMVSETGSFAHYKRDPNDPTSISDDYVNAIIQSRSGYLYLSTYDTLDRFDRETGEFEHFGHTSSADNGNGGGEIMGLMEDSSGRIWLFTTSGLEYFDSDTERFVRFTLEDGLLSENIQSALEDDAGNLWLGTSKGLTVFEGAVADPATARFRNITQAEGLSSNHFNKRASHIGLDGTFYFGSSIGYTYFQPSLIQYNEIPPPIVLTELLSLETSPDSPSVYRPSGIDINSHQSVTFPYSKSNFIIKFAALNYVNSELNQYRYLLEGYDQDWVDSGTLASASYTHLPPGEYTFHVTGSNNDGVWSNQVKHLHISITPPWWGTLGFRILAISIIVLLIVSIYRMRFALLRKQRAQLEARVLERTAELEDAMHLASKQRNEIAQQNAELNQHRDHLEQMIQDRTRELETAKVQAEESDQLKSSFLMNMSHEIRTPMNAIVGFSSLLNTVDFTKEEQAQYLKAIEENGHSLTVLIDEILDISLIQTDRLRLSEETFRLDTVMRELRDFYQLKSEKNLEVLLVNQDEIDGFAVTADPVRFRQILNNLLGNAYKYTDAGKIQFGCKKFDDEILFEVSDTGLGIPKEDQKRIFEHFYKVERNNNRLYPGTGIGLSICSKLVTKMGGRIWVESELGKGTKFSFTLPIQEPIQAAKPNAAETKSELNLYGTTVLVAEDNDTNFELVRVILRETGANIHRSINGQQVLDFIGQHTQLSNLVILMDIKLPLVDGCEACERIKASNPDIPIIAVTAYAHQSDKERFTRLGFDATVTKPISQDKLLQELSNLAGRLTKRN